MKTLQDETLADLVSVDNTDNLFDANGAPLVPDEATRDMTPTEKEKLTVLERRAKSANKRGVQLLLEIKDILYQAHELLNHVGGGSRYSEWVAEHFPDLSQKTAERYVQVHNAFAEVKNDTLSKFEVTALYLLAREDVPTEARQLAIDLAGRDKLVTAKTARLVIAIACGNRLPQTKSTRRPAAAKEERIKTMNGEVIVRPINNSLNLTGALEEAMQVARKRLA